MLDVTLRSLSASKMPNVPVTIFDDGSQADAKKYLHTNETVSLKYNFPNDHHWRALDLGDVQTRDRAKGIAGRVRVKRLGDKPMGVVSASCAAIRMLTLGNVEMALETGVILLQDDVVFNPDWYERLLAAADWLYATKKVRAGVIAGVTLNRAVRNNQQPVVRLGKKAPTAQCYLITTHGLGAAAEFIAENHKIKKGFDDKLCGLIRQQHPAFVMNPPICQHIGIVSTVRKGRKWRCFNPKGRVGYQAKGPYPLAKDVKNFGG